MTDLIKRLRDEAALLIGHGIDRGSQEATISGKLANEAADAIEAMEAALSSIAEKDVAYLKTPTSQPQPGYPGYFGHIARKSLAGGGAPKFSKTFCSSCGRSFGPGDHGFSHCSDHA